MSLPAAQEIERDILQGGLLHDEDPARGLVAMLSGGRDSVCLLALAARLRRPGTVTALHVNYGLRPDAITDERHCLALCATLDVPLRVVRAQARTRPPGNLQAWARETRYAAAESLAGTHDALIASAHTATDQVETILYRLAASPGRRALLGMAPREGRLIRPLLSLTRDQTGAYCRARGLSWRDDPTNDSDVYARNRVRASLVPALDEIHPAAQANVLATAALLREETALLDDLVDRELGGADAIAVARLAELPAALARLVVIRLAEDVAMTFVPQAGARVAEIVDLARRRSRCELHVGGLVAAVVEDGLVRMRRLPPRTTPEPRSGPPDG